MIALKALIQKEYMHILRDKRTLLIIIGIPIVQILLFGFAISTEVRNIKVGILAPDNTQNVAKIERALSNNEYFSYQGRISSDADVVKEFQKSNLDVVVAFDQNFDSEIFDIQGAKIQIIADAADPSTGQSYVAYTRGAISSALSDNTIAHNGINTTIRFLYNPGLKSSYGFVPGIMGLILIIICAMITSASIVKEKETGTIEVLMASPVRPKFTVFAKMIPYFTIACLMVGLILVMSVYVLDVPIVGSLFWVIFISLLYSFIALALGLLISTVVNTQLAALLASAMVLMLPSLLLSGMIFPIENMPEILQWISCIMPPRWYISAIRKIMIEGLPISYAAKELTIMAIMAITIIATSLKLYKNRLL